MSTSLKRGLAALAVFGPMLTVAAVPEAFLKDYCIECHGAEKQKGDRRFDELSFPLKDKAAVIDAQDIIDQLTLGDMPPKKAAQPTDAQRTAMIDQLTQGVAAARESLQTTGAQTVLRRLNRREYLNTIGDLFAMDMTSFDPTAKFPRDQTVGQMDNIGDALVTSGYLLDQYLDAADQIVEKALGMTEKPAEQTWHFDKNFQQGQELSYSHKRVYGFRYLCVYEVPNTVNHEGGYAAIHEFSDGVPADGLYEIKVLAHAMNRQHPYEVDIFKMDPEDPFRLGIVPGDARVGTLHHPQPIEPQLAEVTMLDGEPEWYTMKVRLEKGQTPRFIFPNGMKNCRQAFQKIANLYRDHWPKDDPYTGGIVEARRIVLQHGKMPHIRIHEVAIRGPIYEEWPPAGQQGIFGKDGFAAGRTREILQAFADRAYRRPATGEEVERLMTVVERRQADGLSPREAVMDALKAVICSPAFLYLNEPDQSKKQAELSAHDLAARLSYFIWSTMPDAELRRAADRGELLKPGVLRTQMERLLAHPRSENMIRGFLDSWLNLRALGDMPPDRDAFDLYYAKDLQNAMKRETQLFMRHLIDTIGPVTDFLDCDYTFVNKPLASLYELPVSFEGKAAHEFQKVSLQDRRRGGLLGMGSVLTVSANGIETSPVIRGVWLLNNVFGTPPPPPPDNVPPIDPDVRGAKSIREIITRHRESATCYGCHQKIDPPGFALENFDPIGAWRTRYTLGKKKGPEIDPSGELPSGEAFKDVTEFKKLLMDRQPLFIRMLTERLLTYATGRRMEALDRPVVNGIVSDLTRQGQGLHSLIDAVVQSSIFRRP